jgi:hypothetical protein
MEIKSKMRALSIGCTGMNERCGAPRNLDFGNDTPERVQETPEILSDSSRAYILRMSSMNEASSKALKERV